MLRHMVVRAMCSVVLMAVLAGCGTDGKAVPEAENKQQPPLAIASASPSPTSSASAEPGRKFVVAPFAVREVNGDRTAVTIVVAGIGGGCSGPARASVSEADGGLLVQAEISVPERDTVPCAASLPMLTVTAELPRPLVQDEQVLGECVPEEATPQGRQCANTHTFATLPPP